MKIFLTVIGLVALIYLSACAYLFSHQRAFLYFPTPRSEAPGAQLLQVRNQGQTLRVWRLGADSDDAIIYFGGNAEDVAQEVPFFEQAFPGRPVYLPNYRGYGGSTGTPSESALFSDALVLFDEVRTRHPRVSVIGRSLGSGVAMHVAANRLVERLVLVTPYDSIGQVAQQHYRWFPVTWFLHDHFDSAQIAHRIRMPTLVLLASNDQVIPRGNSQALIAKLPAPLTTVKVIAHSNHNSIGAEPSYWSDLRAFLAAEPTR